MACTINTSPGVGTGRIVKTADSSGVLKLQSNGRDVLTINTDGSMTVNGSLQVPQGTTAQRPSSPVNGMIRYNTTIPQLEVYINGWQTLP